jgi:hypothetical protein
MGEGDMSGKSAADAGDAHDPATATAPAAITMRRRMCFAPVSAIDATRLDMIGSALIVRRNRKAIWFTISCRALPRVDDTGVFADAAPGARRRINHSARVGDHDI